MNIDIVHTSFIEIFNEFDRGIIIAEQLYLFKGQKYLLKHT